MHTRLVLRWLTRLAYPAGMCSSGVAFQCGIQGAILTSADGSVPSTPMQAFLIHEARNSPLPTVGREGPDPPDDSPPVREPEEPATGPAHDDEPIPQWFPGDGEDQK